MTGASPASDNNMAAVGNRVRSSPTSANNTALNTGPTPGKLANTAASGCSASAEAMASSKSLSYSLSTWSRRAKDWAEKDLPATVPAEADNRLARRRSASTWAGARPV